MPSPTRKALTLSLIALMASAPLQAAITYSGVQNINVTNDFDGVYIDLTDPLDATAFTAATSEPVNWDLNPFFGGSAFGNSDTFLVATDDGTTNSTLQNFTTSVIIGDGLGEGEIFVSDFSGSTDHMAGPSGEFVAGVEGYIGFRIDDGSSGFYNGWMRVTLRDDGSAGTIHDWAWETSGAQIQVGAIPEPSAMLLGLLGTLLLLRRRK